MGVRLSWIAVEHGDPAALLEQLGLSPCGTASHEMNSQFACAVLPSGWFVLTARATGFRLEETAAQLSARACVLGGEVVESLTFSRLLGCRDGRQAWAVVHDPEVARDEVVATGTPPDRLEAIRAELAGEQAAAEAGVDVMFEVPIRLGEALCGYSPLGAPPVEWTVLEPSRPGRPDREPPQLAPRIRSELVPALASLGWTPREPRDRLEFDFARIRDGERQELLIQYGDAPKALWMRLEFVVWNAAGPEAAPKTRGWAEEAPRSLGRRLADLLRGVAARRTYGDRVSALLGQAREELALIERFLSEGASDPRLYIERWRPPAPEAD